MSNLDNPIQFRRSSPCHFAICLSPSSPSGNVFNHDHDDVRKRANDKRVLLKVAMRIPTNAANAVSTVCSRSGGTRSGRRATSIFTRLF